MGFLKKFNKTFFSLVLVIQKIILYIALFFIYFIGFGITFIFAWLCNRKQFRVDDQELDSYWRVAVDYESSEAELLRQS